MAMLTGNDIVIGAKTVHRIKEAKVDATTGTITLGADVKAIQSVYLLDGDGVTNKTLLTVGTTAVAGSKYEYNSSTGVLTFHADDKGALARVYYTKDTEATAATIKVTSDKFGGTFKMVADVLIRDEATSKDFYGQFIVPRAKIEDDFSFNFSPEGDPSVLDIPLEILKDPASTNMWELVIYSE